MPDNNWLGNVEPTRQEIDGSIDTLGDSNFTVTIGTASITVAGITDPATTATALVLALNASTHPYISSVTWTAPGGGAIKGVHDFLGQPVFATLSEDGTGTVTDFTDTVASTGPNHADNPLNWSLGLVPVVGDTVNLRNNPTSILFGMDFTGFILAAWNQDQTYTGLVGLASESFLIDGTNSNSNFTEYRQDYMQIKATRLNIGLNTGTGTPAGSQRTKIENLEPTMERAEIFNTAAKASEVLLPAVRLLLAGDSSSELIVHEAPGGVGVAIDKPGETSSVDSIKVLSRQLSTKVILSNGVDWDLWEQFGGTNKIDSSTSPVSIKGTGGKLAMNGSFLPALLQNDGMQVEALNVPGGIAITTVVNNNGLISTSLTDPQTFTNYSSEPGASLKYLPSLLTRTNNNEPTAEGVILESISAA